jgi:hypothetical protein
MIIRPLWLDGLSMQSSRRTDTGGKRNALEVGLGKA